MPTVAHKNLTGTDLHEPKGIAAAAVDKVYVSNGAGSGAWQKVSKNQLDATGNPFGAGLLHLQDQQTSGTGGQSIVNSTWTAVRLNTAVTNEISASLASNQVTLSAGTYFIDAIFDLGQTSDNAVSKLKLYNVTDATDTLFGLNAGGFAAVGGSSIELAGGGVHPSLKGRFTIAGSKVFEVRYYTNGGVSGLAISAGTEIYANVMIWKVA